MRKAKQQGALDGLCGVYALVHFLRRFEYFSGYDDVPAEREAFQCVLETAERMRLLTASSIYDGYSGHQLRAILNMIIDEVELPFKTHLIPVAAKAMKVDSFKEFADRTLKKKAFLISNYSRGNHWVFVHQSGEDGLIIDNSSGVDPADQILTPRQCGSIDLSDGVLILPISLNLAAL